MRSHSRRYGRGYSGYRGRSSGRRPLIYAFLVLVIILSVFVIVLSQNAVYDANGHIRFLLPEQLTSSAEEDEPEVPLDLTIETAEPEPAAVEPVHSIVRLQQLAAAPLTQAELTGLPPEGTGVAILLKDASGHLYFPSQSHIQRATKVSEDTATTIAAILSQDRTSAAVLSCFADPLAANAEIENMGLKNTGGYIFYDGNNNQWLDPNKEGARSYLCSLIQEIVSMGFEEILLTDVSYPLVGKLNKINYGTNEPEACLQQFLQEAKATVGNRAVLSLELPASVLLNGQDEASKQVLALLAPEVDRIYAEAADAPTAEALREQVLAAAPETEFVPIFSELPEGYSGNSLLR